MAVNNRIILGQPLQVASSESELPALCRVRGKCPFCSDDHIVYRRLMKVFRGTRTEYTRQPSPCLCLNCGCSMQLEEVILA